MKPISKRKAMLQVRKASHLLYPFLKQRTRAVINPFQPPIIQSLEPREKEVETYSYNPVLCKEHVSKNISDGYDLKDIEHISWINLQGLDVEEIEAICAHYEIHPLIQEDIISYGQRPKVDEVNNVIYVLINMLYYNNESNGIEQEQISLVLGDHFLLSFQEDAKRDVFNPLRSRLKNDHSKIRNSPTDYLLYTMIDIIVDSYFTVIEKVGEKIELAEDDLLTNTSRAPFENISQMRKELILLKRNTVPVRDLVSGLLRSENELLDDKTTKYYKDVHDHIMQANDLVDNYRDLVNTLQDMYFNNVNLRMNEVMKTLAIVTTVMAPATVIGGIFGMNFEVIPYAHQKWGFYVTIIAMILIPIVMIWWFRKRGWFKQFDL